MLSIMIFQLCLLSAVYVISGQGMKAPEFMVMSGDGKKMSLKDLLGTVITIFYENREAVEKNRVLKDELNRFYHTQPDQIKGTVSRVSIIDCKGAFWPFIGVWKNKLVEASKKEGITIYGDWDGSFAKDYEMMEGESNFIIIDNKGIIRYANAGKIEGKEISAIEELLTELSKGAGKEE